jgi:hypothetical protein
MSEPTHVLVVEHDTERPEVVRSGPEVDRGLV